MKSLAINEINPEDIVNFWNRNIGKDFPMTIELFQQNTLESELLCRKSTRIVMNRFDEIIALIVAKKNKEINSSDLPTNTGWIQVLIVDKEFRKQGIGSHLLSLVEDKFKEDGIEKLFIGKDPYHYFPGVPSQYKQTVRWFEKRGYQRGRVEYDLINKYSDAEKNKEFETIKDKEITISLLKSHEKELLLAFMKKEFPGRWVFELKEYFKHNGNGREFIILKEKGKIIGFARINDSLSPIIAQNTYWSSLFDEELAGIGPLGIASNKRAKGYGLIIVKAAISTLRKRALTPIVIDWTSLVKFYNKLGFNIWKSYDTYSKSF